MPRYRQEMGPTDWLQSRHRLGQGHGGHQGSLPWWQDWVMEEKTTPCLGPIQGCPHVPPPGSRKAGARLGLTSHHERGQDGSGHRSFCCHPSIRCGTGLPMVGPVWGQTDAITPPIGAGECCGQPDPLEQSKKGSGGDFCIFVMIFVGLGSSETQR